MPVSLDVPLADVEPFRIFPDENEIGSGPERARPRERLDGSSLGVQLESRPESPKHLRNVEGPAAPKRTASVVRMVSAVSLGKGWPYLFTADSPTAISIKYSLKCLELSLILCRTILAAATTSLPMPSPGIIPIGYVFAI